MRKPSLNTLILTVSSLTLLACSQGPASVVRYGASHGEGSSGAHTVLRGDTLYSISKQYRLPITEIVTLNNISEPYTLNTGYRLKLPPPNEHTVRNDDTIAGIARTYSVSPSQLVSLNDLRPPYDLKPGQVLRLPTPTKQEEFDRYDVPQETENRAPVSGVEREELGVPSAAQNRMGQSRVGRADQNATGQTKPSAKPTVQSSDAKTQAQVQKTSSAARSKALDTIPQRTGNGKFMRPVEGRVISGFGPKKDGLHNDGINIKAARGAPVRAAENGRVVYVGDDLEGYGNLILVRHADRYMSAYAHLGKSLVQKGDAVKRGQSIGTVGSSGKVDTPQLHFEIRKGTKALNPKKYL